MSIATHLVFVYQQGAQFDVRIHRSTYNKTNQIVINTKHSMHGAIFRNLVVGMNEGFSFLLLLVDDDDCDTDDGHHDDHSNTDANDDTGHIRTTTAICDTWTTHAGTCNMLTFIGTAITMATTVI